MADILYSFADVSADTGVISLTDSYADEQVTFLRVCDYIALQYNSETLPYRLLERDGQQSLRMSQATLVSHLFYSSKLHIFHICSKSSEARKS